MELESYIDPAIMLHETKVRVGLRRHQVDEKAYVGHIISCWNYTSRPQCHQ